MKYNVWFIIVIYRPNLRLLERNIRELKGYNVVVVDNRQDKGSSVTGKKSVKIIKSGQNLGYAGGNNCGANYALQHGADWIVILNDDLEFSSRSIAEFSKNLENLGPSLVGPYLGSFEPKRWTTLFDQSVKYVRADNQNYLSGSFLAVHKDVIKTLGQLFFDPYFIYYEDAELAVRAQAAGYQLNLQKVEHIKHRASESFGAGSRAHQYYLARNHLLFVERNAPRTVKLRELIRLPRTIYDHYRLKEYGALRGIYDYLWRRFGKGI